jgi:hypothetical protein
MKEKFRLVVAYALLSLFVVASSTVMAAFTPSTDGQARLTDEDSGLYVIDLAGGYIYNATINESKAGGDLNMSGYTLRDALFENVNLSSDIDAKGYRIKDALIDASALGSDLDANGYRVNDVVLNNVTLLSPELRTVFFDFRENRINNITQIHGTTQLWLRGSKQSDQDKSDAAIVLQNASLSGRIYFYTPNAAGTGLISRIMIEGAGDGYQFAQFNTTVRPWINNTVDLGAPTLKWKTIYAVTTDFGDIIIDDQVVLRASNYKLNFYSYNPQTKQLIEKIMELDLLTGNLKIKGRLYENAIFEPLSSEEKRVGG